MKTYWGIGGIAPFVGGQLHVLFTLPTGEGAPQHALVSRLFEPQSQSGYGGKEKKCQLLGGNQMLVIPTVAYSLY
jgi:hypothetical protein